jgi:parvulin-like peptidyl-prolyl isomerase
VGANADVDKVEFSLPAGAVSDPIATTDGTVIVKVVERHDVTPDEFRKAKDTFRAQLLNERRDRFFTAYMNRVKENTKIDVKTDVLRRVTATAT